ncbi:hypothetical protein EVAR_103412_1 [Eumeta japonica]|uniref:Uncharacterized protein n=1 Tax=Eumeta variegata TaxID=151549 RepID=A0A4C1YW21_EUMVA|nr:hypothetical protein EVAR_103412_1 [Eumeta japonica]
MIITELERIKVGKFQDPNVKDEYVERLKCSLGEIKHYECLELDELSAVTQSVSVDKAKKKHFGKEIVIEVAVSEKNSSEYVLKIYELSTLATADDFPRCRSLQLYAAKRHARPAVIRVTQPRLVVNLE